ncbi:GNAT family N-acetyltransferase [Streptomyces sp. ALI-76-A]|jgi:GNAT superfamily N-acetyltransferase|uniref:GNAT family N-acetyltransferase n=1 Tax=Streptomyces sp. ALI-76-A TaxID=3025736 RepID=UPI00256F1307|nr:GNAT family N-acetyltransferase [Streptomyces sp. ALI-76-A]MDL5205775.1 GNAT family N-acetyltransferase [Streptomyces sp. ALI-76-A]
MTASITPEGGPATIRRAVARDAKRLTRLVRGSRAYHGQYAAMVADYRVGPDYIEAHQVFVAVATDAHGSHVLGFYSLVLDPPELDLLFVADGAQGRGLGRLLVAHMKTEARAAGLDHVRVVSHPPAEGFYRSVGAVRTGTAAANPPAVVWDRPELEFRLPPDVTGTDGKVRRGLATRSPVHVGPGGTA